MEKKSSGSGSGNRNSFVSWGVLVIGLALSFFIWKFNSGGHSFNKYLLGNIMLLFWVPVLTVLFVFREDVKEYGIKLPDKGKWIWLVTFICMIGIAVIIYFPSKWEQFQSYYPIFKQFRHSDPMFFAENPFKADFGKMFFAEACYGFYMFCWEFFFRGYLTCALSRKFGLWAVIIQAVPFALLHIGKPLPETISSFFAGIALGLLAYYGKSFIPAFILHLWVSVTFDIMVILNR